ncbi:hypothetical protein EV189_0953 [Motilibacter rhizosphaerae]|uniref:ABC3 transporter permease C-terminal domain-containing protein n=1 Tax=Motilibacter rhizosphaerae TaxID=598652 RepID=A0A4Q7NWL0_9ACTN|nr:FtsX-like permease family protein [Motilibacter rhizosphaerae]RZS91706.1 hypothetical protein EV189_0953 [Motilibacter rhizosphaerae]
MLALLAPRARVQLPLLAAVLAVVTMGATLLGVSALLLTSTQERALDVAFVRAPAHDRDVTAIATGVHGRDVTAVAAAEDGVVRWALAPLGSSSARRMSTSMRLLDGPTGVRRLGYLSALDALPEHAELTSGHWPRAGGAPGAAIEAVVPQSTARLLHLEPGAQVALGREVGSGDPVPPVTVTVVGTFRPRPDAGWDRDLLVGSGADLAYRDGYSQELSRAYGPFVVAVPDLVASGSTVDRLDVTASPQLGSVTRTRLAAVSGRLAAADARLSAVLGQRPTAERVASELPRTLALGRTQQAATRAVVLVVVLLAIALTAAALGLGGRLVAALRQQETELLAGLGAGRGQLAAVAGAEAAALAVLAALLALPLSALVHAGLTHLPVLADAGLAAGPRTDRSQVLAVVVGAVALAAVLVVPALRPDRGERAATRSTLRGAAARSGVDVLLLALALVGWEQLRDQPTTGSGRTDAVLVLAPALCLVAGAVLVLRLVPPPLHALDRLARRARGLLLPLAAFEAARRPQAAAAALLLALAAAEGTFGLSFGATWLRAQHDQAALRVGTDLSATVLQPPDPGSGAAVLAAAGGTVSPVTARPVIVGGWAGQPGVTPRLVAVDTTRAGALLRGRLDAAGGWAAVGRRLAPDRPVRGIALDSGTSTLTGSAGPGVDLVATPSLLVQDALGVRAAAEAAPVRLDGRPHPVVLRDPLPPGLHLVGVDLMVDAADPSAPVQVPSSLVHITLRVSGSSPAETWAAVPVGGEGALLSSPDVSRSGSTLSADAAVAVPGLPYGTAELLLTAFPRPTTVPVALSRRLADGTGTQVGSGLTVTVGTTAVTVRVAAVVPDVPSQPGGVTLLADADLLSRSLLSAGDLTPAVDAWWIGSPTQDGAAQRLRALATGEVSSRPEVDTGLVRGPLRIELPAALGMLLAAAALLALAGTALHVTSDLQDRAVEVARLRGLGLPRRTVLAGLLLQHGAVLALLVALGAVVGAVSSWAVAPRLVRSDVGGAPVPGVLRQWPWLAEVGLLAALLLGCLAVTAAVVAVQVRRADSAHLRVAS